MVSPADVEYAQRLRGLRLSKNMKQSEASELLNFKSQQQYSRLENGLAIFTDEIILQICEAFEISPQQFTNTGYYNFVESPHANSPHSTHNSHNNDVSIIQETFKVKDELLKSKDEIIKIKGELIEKLKQENEMLRQSRS